MNASEALSCIKKQWYSKHQPDLAAPQDWGFARRGKGIEAFVVSCLKASGVDIRLTGKDQETIYSDQHKISATPDGVEVSNEGLFGVEFKSIDPRKDRSKLPTKEHVTQLQLGMKLVDMIKGDLGLPDLPFKGGTIIYTDASNWSDHLEFKVPFKDGILDELSPRAKKVLTARKVGNLPREGKSNAYECKYCAYAAVCGAQGAEVAASGGAGKGNRGSRLETVLADYTEAKSMKDRAEKDVKAASERIKSELAKRKVTELDIAGRHISLSSVSGRVSLDKKAVKEAGIDLTPFEKVGAPSERLTVK